MTTSFDTFAATVEADRPMSVVEIIRIAEQRGHTVTINGRPTTADAIYARANALPVRPLGVLDVQLAPAAIPIGEEFDHACRFCSAPARVHCDCDQF